MACEDRVVNALNPDLVAPPRAQLDAIIGKLNDAVERFNIRTGGDNTLGLPLVQS